MSDSIDHTDEHVLRDMCFTLCDIPGESYKSLACYFLT